jgi:nitroimidazol reductase NimA-like FMN-containing flavoprotein (pyridoxamine 5'-phosphate oxidase superfamily)
MAETAAPVLRSIYPAFQAAMPAAARRRIHRATPLTRERRATAAARRETPARTAQAAGARAAPPPTPQTPPIQAAPGLSSRASPGRKNEDRTVRRKDREITAVEDKLAILRQCTVLRLALAHNNTPYVVPLHYGYRYENEKLTLFFHGAREGKKVDMIKANNVACFELDCDTALIEGDKACQYSSAYKSIIGFGNVIILEAPSEKRMALNELMKHQTGQDRDYQFSDDALDRVLVFKLEAASFTGKQKVMSD